MEEEDVGRWVASVRFRDRDYAGEAMGCCRSRVADHDHPFSPPTRLKPRPVSSLPQDDEFVDPLRASNMHNSATAEQIVTPFSRPSNLEVSMIMGGFQNKKGGAAADWNEHKTSILQRYASTGTITISASFDIIPKDPKGRLKSLTEAHLEELGDYHEEVKTISQQEYVTRLHELKDEIAQAWINNERVGALRLSIKVAKLLSDTSVPQFYPTLFVLVTDVMDTVGNLVWNRIRGKAEMDEDGNPLSSLPEMFTADQVRNEAKDTCSNWFYKIGSIHELLPRIYLEIAILHCMQFLENGPPIAAFQRLTMMARGLSDPLSAAYVRLYLARKGQAIIPSETGFLVVALDDYLLLFQRVLSGDFNKSLTKACLDIRGYVILVEPVFDWMLQCIFKNVNLEEMAFFIRTFGNHENGVNNNQKGPRPVSVIIHYLLKHLPATAIAAHAQELSRIIRDSDSHSMPQHLNYRLFGSRLCECSLHREECVTVLTDVWKVVMKYTNLVEYLTVADAFVDFILQNCSDIELNALLHDVMKHLGKMEVTATALATLESFMFKLMTFSTDIECILALPYFRSILDVFYGDARLSIYKHIAGFVSRNNSLVFDPVARHFMFELCKSLHDSLDSMSSKDDQRQIAWLISRFVQKVDFGSDVDHHLSFLADCHGAFVKMDMLKEVLVHSCNRLAVSTLSTVKKGHSKDSLSFVKACVTFNEITLPSIRNLITRAHLYLETAEVALMNALLSHVDGLVKSIISLLQEFHETNNQFSEECVSFVRKLCSFFVVVPGHPDLGAFYLLRGLMNVLNIQTWMQDEQGVQILCPLLILCCTLSQKHLPYHVNNSEVISNDELYNGEMSYHEELISLAKDIMKNIYILASRESQMQGVQALDTCNQLLLALVTKDDEPNKLCTYLIQKSVSSLPKNNTYLKSTMNFAESRGLRINWR